MRNLVAFRAAILFGNVLADLAANSLCIILSFAWFRIVQYFRIGVSYQPYHSENQASPRRNCHHCYQTIAHRHWCQLQSVCLIITFSYTVEVHKEENDNTFLNELNLRPALRHHIAHFCPNLDIARQCIRKCMESGKPAFCGKDHKCYCGHKYTPHDKNSVANADEVYRNFQDLYAKYFGKRPPTEERIVESQN